MSKSHTDERVLVRREDLRIALIVKGVGVSFDVYCQAHERLQAALDGPAYAEPSTDAACRCGHEPSWHQECCVDASCDCGPTDAASGGAERSPEKATHRELSQTRSDLLEAARAELEAVQRENEALRKGDGPSLRSHSAPASEDGFWIPNDIAGPMVKALEFYAREDNYEAGIPGEEGDDEWKPDLGEDGGMGGRAAVALEAFHVWSVEDAQAEFDARIRAATGDPVGGTKWSPSEESSTAWGGPLAERANARIRDLEGQLAEQRYAASELASQLSDERFRFDVFQKALQEIATRPTTELNPDGVDQAAWSMQLIAQEALGQVVEEQASVPDNSKEVQGSGTGLGLEEQEGREVFDSKIVSKAHWVESMAQSLWDAVAEYQGLSGGRLPDSYRPLYETLARKALDTLDGERPSPAATASDGGQVLSSQEAAKTLMDAGMKAAKARYGVDEFENVDGPLSLIRGGTHGASDVLIALDAEGFALCRRGAEASAEAQSEEPGRINCPCGTSYRDGSKCPNCHPSPSIGDASERLTEHEELTWKALRAYGDWIHPHRVQERITWTGSFSLVGEVLDALVAKGYAQINMSGQYYRARPAPSVPDLEAAHTSKYATGGNVYEDDGPPTASHRTQASADEPFDEEDAERAEIADSAYMKGYEDGKAILVEALKNPQRVLDDFLAANPEEAAQFEAAKQSVIDARGSAARNEGNIVIGSGPERSESGAKASNPSPVPLVPVDEGERSDA